MGLADGHASTVRALAAVTDSTAIDRKIASDRHHVGRLERLVADERREREADRRQREAERERDPAERMAAEGRERQQREVEGWQHRTELAEVRADRQLAAPVPTAETSGPAASAARAAEDGATSLEQLAARPAEGDSPGDGPVTPPARSRRRPE